MPLLRYFGVVGPALLALLLIANWLMPETVVEPTHASIERPSIRISSIEKLPERVVFDTALPPIALPPRAIPIAIEPPQSAFAFVQITPGPLPTFVALAEVAPKQPVAAKREPARKLAARHAPPPASNAAAKNHNVRQAQSTAKPPVRPTLLADIAGRIGQLFKVN